MTTNSTPCAVLFHIMKKYGGISNKELASLILSGKPLSDGQSPVSRIDDRSWLSRFVVNAPAGSHPDRYFADFTVSALRVVARLKSKRGRSLSDDQILDLICGKHGREMEEALKACHQDVHAYRNMLTRLQDETRFSLAERVDIAMVFFLTTACTANIRQATAVAMEFTNSIYGQNVATPLVTPNSQYFNRSRNVASLKNAAMLGLLRIVDGYVVGAPHWIPSGVDQAIIGSIATGDYSITDVESDVSSSHARLYKHDDAWYIEGMESLNGTALINGSTQERVVVEPPKSERIVGQPSQAVRIEPGDKIVLGSRTIFVVIEGLESF